jgi:hypothetical protein
MMLISPTLVLVFVFLPVVVTVTVAVAAEDSPMMHHTGRSGTTVQKQIASRQQRLFDITTETDIV